MTVSGEMIDLKAVVDQTLAKGKVAGIVAASFGAVSTALLSGYLESRVGCIVLWNPVLNLQDTFVRPKTPWARKNFSGRNVKNIFKTGTFRIDKQFQVGAVFWEELHHFRPDTSLAKTKLPILILHGDRDSYVPFSIAKTFSKRRARTKFIRVKGSDHGFPVDRDEKFAIAESVKFISQNS
jgi:pimeloyl-ACP methyl ester carboxylesterase